MAPRAKSAARSLPDGPSEEFQDADAQLPRGCRRWWPDFRQGGVSGGLRREVRNAIPRQPPRRSFAMWQMNFPAELPNGQRNPVCSLGECGDPSCPTYRPKRPEVRRAVEQCILEKCQSHFKAGTLKTYASIGCGLLGQDWIVLEQLREEGLLPRRAVFVELRTARPVMTCEGSDFPRLSGGGGINLRQTGFTGDLGPEFAFSATLQFDQPIATSSIFDFSNDQSHDRIFVEACGPEKIGSLRFGAQVGTQTHSFLVDDCWDPSERPAHSFLFTVSAVGMYNVFRDGELIGRSYGFAPSSCSRKHLYVGQGPTTKMATAFRGRIQKIKVWDQEVDPMATDMAYSHEVGNAHQTIAQWYKNEMDVYSFGSLAAYAAACAKDARFAADLLVKIDVHDDLDGYDDFVCKALDANGLALTLGGPGKSWRRSGTGWLPVDLKCPVLDSAEEKVLVPWAFQGSFPGCVASAFAADAQAARAENGSEGRRPAAERRPQRYGRGHLRRGISSRRCKADARESREGRWYGMTDEAVALPKTSVDELLEEMDLSHLVDACSRHGLLSQLEAMDEEEDELPGLVVYGP